MIGIVLLAPAIKSEFRLRSEISAAEKAGDQLAAAFDRFYAAHHFYPENVDDLLGDFLSRISDPTISGKICRWSCTGGPNKFELHCVFQREDLIGVTVNYALIYESESRRWRVRELRS